MPHLIITPAALNAIARCARFLRERNPAAQERAVIEQWLAVLIQTPAIGRPYRAEPTKRELVIPSGGSGHLTLSRHEEAADAVTILAFRHQREPATERQSPVRMRSTSCFTVGTKPFE